MSNSDELQLEASDATILHLALLELGHSIAPSDSPPGRENALAHLRTCAGCQADLVRLINVLVQVRSVLDGPRCH